MVKIVVYDNSLTYLKSMKTRIQTFIEKAQVNMRIGLLTTQFKKILEYVETDEALSVYILDVNYKTACLNGIQIAKTIRAKDRNAYIVFSTKDKASVYQAMTGLIRPSGFFTKPFDKDDLEILMGDIYRDYLNIMGETSNVFHVNIGTMIYAINYDDILYFEACQKKIYIHTLNQRIAYYDCLANIEKMLNEQFMRCHRSYIVNISKIKEASFTLRILEMMNGGKINISRTYKDTIRKRLKL